MDMEVDDGCFHHPVVVVSTELARGKAIVLIVSILILNIPKNDFSF